MSESAPILSRGDTIRLQQGWMGPDRAGEHIQKRPFAAEQTLSLHEKLFKGRERSSRVEPVPPLVELPIEVVKIDQQRVCLGREEIKESPLRDTGPGHDLIDADSIKAGFAEERNRGPADPGLKLGARDGTIPLRLRDHSHDYSHELSNAASFSELALPSRPADDDVLVRLYFGGLCP